MKRVVYSEASFTRTRSDRDAKSSDATRHAMVIHDASTTPGLVLRCKIIGVLQTIQRTKHNQIRNDRVIAVPEDSHREQELHGVGDLPPEVKEELEKFFVATDELEAKTLKFLGWQGPAQAKKLVRRCEKIFKRKN